MGNRRSAMEPESLLNLLNQALSPSSPKLLMKSTFGLTLVVIATTAVIVNTGNPATTLTLRRELAEDRSCNFACLAVMRPVYDENGKMYSNECVMEREKCKEQKAANVKEKPRDDPASDSKSKAANVKEKPRDDPASDSKSKADEDSTQQDDSSCRRFCFDVYDPVTDENGKTYSNECYMKRAKCKDKKGDDGDAGDILKEYERIYGKPFGASHKSNVEDDDANK